MNRNRFRKALWYLETAPRLGIGNVLYVLYYRVRLRRGLLVRKFPVANLQGDGPVFSGREPVDGFPAEWKSALLEQADRITGGILPYYSCHWMDQSTPPNWFLNPFNGKEWALRDRHWTSIPDFHEEYGDIKNIWEISRFTWVGILARAYAVSGKEEYLQTLNEWLGHWMKQNPLNRGPHWKCGQETSFRIFQLLNAAHILDQAGHPGGTLVRLIEAHLSRVSSNLRYAVSQRNNHATSEATALFIGGHWLLATGASDSGLCKGYARKGRRVLERMAGKLTYSDGGFSQHSTCYHRLFLDTVTLALFWCRKLDLEPLSGKFTEHASRSLRWLLSMIDGSGKSPNYGSNDGTLLQSNHSCESGDYRPSLQAASAILESRRIFERGAYDEALFWYGIDPGELGLNPFRKENRVNGAGTVIMEGRGSWAMLRYPFYRFRPAHNDVFHFDLWAGGSNLLFDSGSYSYNPDKGSGAPDLKSVLAHNTLSFDGGEQMPRVSRFLMAKWIKPLHVGPISGSSSGGTYSWEGSYRSHSGNVHRRRISWGGDRWEVRDVFHGKAGTVEIGFNFGPGDHTLDPGNQTLDLPWGRIEVTGKASLGVREHRVSPCYMQLAEVNRLVITAPNNSEITTTIQIES